MESAVSSIDSSFILLGGVLVLCLLWWLSTRRPPGLPPGPGPALPLLGHMHLLPKDPRPQLWTWKRQYGDVVSLYLGGQLTVVLTSYSAIREALVTFADVFSDRPMMSILEKIGKNKGIVSSSGSTWKEQRKISMEILRHLGMGKNVLADRIQEEITHYTRAIKDHHGAPMELHRLTQRSVCNIACHILFGKRFQYDDEDFVQYLRIMEETAQLIGSSAALNFIPILEYLPGDVFHMKLVLSNTALMHNFIRQQVREHQENFKDDEESMDFIHAYLRRMHSRKDSETTVNESNLVMSCFDLFAAGTETTALALTWALLFFLHFPEVQEKCYREICDIIGPTQAPEIRNRADLVYVEATVMEVLRKANVVPLSILHSLSADVKFRDYVIPKGTFVIPCLEMALSDPDIWGDPEDFRPERFIGPDGKVTRVEEFIPFSMGRRVCLGESLARMELFLYLTTLIQHFRFLPPEDGELPSLKGTLGITHLPKPFNIRAEIRK